MQKALNQYGQSVLLYHSSKQEIKQWKETRESFYCPSCRSKVIIRSGKKVIPHFSHLADAVCSIGAGGEGIYHETGKYQLYQWFRKQNIEVDVEVFFPKIQRRADLVIKLRNKMIVIEFQCVHIPEYEIKERTNDYHQLGIHVIWIVGMKQFKRYGRNQFQINSFLQACIHQFPRQPTPSLYFFDPISQHFVSLKHIYKYQSTRAFATMNVTLIKNLNFIQLFTDTPMSAYFRRDWILQIQRIRNKVIPHYGNEMNWRSWLYNQGMVFQYLPSICFLPNEWQFQMSVPLWQWQGELFVKLFHPISIHHSFHVSNCSRIINMDTQLQLPNIHTEPSALDTFITNLELLGYFEQKSKGVYTKVKEIPVYQNVEQAVKGDKRIIQQFFMEKMGKIRA